MSSRLLLVRHAPTPATRRACFPADEPLDEAGVLAARKLAKSLPGRIDLSFASPFVRARQTAEAMGFVAEVDDDLRECDFGSWAGLSLQEVGESDPEGLASWFVDPGARPHGGESLTHFGARVGRFLKRAAARPGTTLAVTHGGVVRVAVVLSLSIPIESFWRIDIAPLSVTELHPRDGTWTISCLNWTARP